jgi:hypothetical protein
MLPISHYRYIQREKKSLESILRVTVTVTVTITVRVRVKVRVRIRAGKGYT